MQEGLGRPQTSNGSFSPTAEAYPSDKACCKNIVKTLVNRNFPENEMASLGRKLGWKYFDWMGTNKIPTKNRKHKVQEAINNAGKKFLEDHLEPYIEDEDLEDE